MMLDRQHIEDATPYIRRAHRCLEMIEWLASQKRLSVEKHVPPYFDSLVECVIALQRILVEDKEYTEAVGKAIAEISKAREYSYNVTQNNDGDVLYAIDAMLPLKAMKRNVLISRRNHHDD